MQRNNKEGSYKLAFEYSRKKLNQLLPDRISNSSLTQYDYVKNCFTVLSFGKEIEISYPKGQVYFKNTNEKLINLSWELILINYLSSSKELPLKDEWVSYRQLPQGNVFFPNIKIHVLDVLSKFISDSDKNLIRNVFIKLGFEFLDSKADIEAISSFVPRVPVKLKFWDGEDDVPSSCQILFDSTIADQIHIEDAAALCSLIKELIITQYFIDENINTRS